MLTRRVIPCLDVEGGRVVKGVRFQNLRDAGDPVVLARHYDAQGADELTFLDITASADKRDILTELVSRVSRELFIPFTVGGGIRSLDDMRAVLDAGADKVAVGTAAVREPDLIAAAAEAFGSQFIVVSLDVRRQDGRYLLTSHGGRRATGVEAIGFAHRVARLGAGEILLNDMDADGTQAGFGIDLLRELTDAVPIPVIASGGAGEAAHFSAAVTEGHADAVLAASVLHFGQMSVHDIKTHMACCGIPIRPVPQGAADEPNHLESAK